MRVLIAPDSFSGTLTALQAAEAMADGWRSVRPDDELVLVPMSDGGEGLIDVVGHAQPSATWHTVEVADARGMATEAVWLELPDGTAVVETARACGLHTLPEDGRDPLRATTYGVGQLLADVAASGCRRVVIGLGGSATVDCGAGMVSAMTGHALRRADGNGVKVGGRWVKESASLRPHTRPELGDVVIASDVTNPLLGSDGAAAVFGPQKGADADGVAELEAAIAACAEVLERDLPGGPWRDRPGAGAAGGLGFALMALTGATPRSGAEVVAELVGLDVQKADVVVTGEGSIDAQTSSGKAPAFVATTARKAGAVTVGIGGRVHPAGTAGFDRVGELGEEGLTRPAGRLADVAAEIAASF